MFRRLTTIWTHLTPDIISDKVKWFFKSYAMNRHKQTVSTPSYHVESYSVDDNRFDLRQFIYNVNWPY